MVIMLLLKYLSLIKGAKNDLGSAVTEHDLEDGQGKLTEWEEMHQRASIDEVSKARDFRRMRDRVEVVKLRVLHMYLLLKRQSLLWFDFDPSDTHPPSGFRMAMRNQYLRNKSSCIPTRKLSHHPRYPLSLDDIFCVRHRILFLLSDYFVKLEHSSLLLVRRTTLWRIMHIIPSGRLITPRRWTYIVCLVRRRRIHRYRVICLLVIVALVNRVPPPKPSSAIIRTDTCASSAVIADATGSHS
jgi:hypothetical protein